MVKLERILEINSKHYLAVIELLRSFGMQARIVGGAVRDSLLSIPSSDIDISTNATPQQVIDICTKQGIKVIPTGIKFGTVTAIIKDESFEITTLRADFDCDGRHTNVVYSNDFAEDAARRDFTINALSYCPVTHIIYDYFSGIADLEAKKVVFIGDTKKRIKEDYLRILRFFRFSCRYAEVIDSDALRVCRDNKDKLTLLSGERIKSELDLLLSLEKSPDVLEKMFEAGILQCIFPVISYNKNLHIQALKAFALFEVKIILPILYAILFRDTPKISLKKLLSLKFSRSESQNIINLIELEDIDDISVIIFKLKKTWLENKDYLLYFIYTSLIIKDAKLIYELYTNLVDSKVPACPVNGNDLLNLGYKGKKLGVALDYIKEKWIKSDFALNRLELISLVNENEK